MSDSLRPHGLQHTRLPCPSPSPGACSNSCPLSWWYHLTISSSAGPFSFCPRSFPELRFFSMSVFFTSGDQSIGASASASVLPMTIQDWFLLGVTGLISLHSKGLSRVFSSTKVQKHQFFSARLSFLFSLIFIIWRLITLQYCSGFCHTWTWISHGFTCTPHPDPLSHLLLYPIPLGFPSAPGPQCLAFFMVQLSHPYLTTGKITALKKPYFWTVPVQDLFPNVTYIRTSCHVHQLSITSWC